MTNRRQFLLTAISASFATLLAKASFKSWGIPSAQAADAPLTDADLARYKDLAKTAADCIKTGEACEAHCQQQLASGNTGFANCDRKVTQMLAMTRAMLSLASQGSPLTPKLAAVCAEACRSCADACAEHKEHFAHGMHLQCKACMEACNACEKACNKVTAA